MKTKAHISVQQAAKLCGVSRSTLYSLINANQLNKTRFGIDIADLRRFYPSIEQDKIDQLMGAESPESVQIEQTESLSAVQMVEWLQDMIEQKDKIIEQKETQLGEANKRIVELTDQSIRLLEAPRAKEGRGGWISRWF